MKPSQCVYKDGLMYFGENISVLPPSSNRIGILEKENVSLKEEIKQLKTDTEDKKMKIALLMDLDY